MVTSVIFPSNLDSFFFTIASHRHMHSQISMQLKEDSRIRFANLQTFSLTLSLSPPPPPTPTSLSPLWYPFLPWSPHLPSSESSTQGAAGFFLFFSSLHHCLKLSPVNWDNCEVCFICFSSLRDHFLSFLYTQCLDVHIFS